MLANSSPVNAGDDILASQYNNLRDDVVNPSTGHNHDGTAGGGTILGSPLKPKPNELVGDGSDGSLTISAPTTFKGLRQFVNLIVDDELKPDPSAKLLIIMVSGTLTVNSGGSIHADGFGAGGGAQQVVGSDGFQRNIAGSGQPSFPLGGTITGTDGNPGERGSAVLAAINDAGEDPILALGAGGGGGGKQGTGGPANGGDKWAGGGAGGATGGQDSGDGGAGGAGAGTVIIFADTIVINGTGRISADGVAGSNSQAGTAGGGGGGGGGGLVYLAYRSLTNNGTIRSIGGAGGLGDTSGGTGNDGGAGAPGLVTQKNIPPA